jgi:hypothetical protein
MQLAALEVALLEKLSLTTVQGIEGFPCSNYSAFLMERQAGRVQVLTRYDPDAFHMLASGIERFMHYLLTSSPILVSMSLVITAIVQRNFWLLLGVPLAILAYLITAPGLMRSFGYRLGFVVAVFAVYSWFQGNRTTAYVLGAYAIASFLVDVARQQCSMILTVAIEKSEIVLVWLCLKGSVVLKK